MPRKKNNTSPTEVLSQWLALPGYEQTSRSAKVYAKKAGMKSMAEVRCAAWLEGHNIKYDYESQKWAYQFEPAHYTPDFVIPTKKFVLEVKGKMTKDVRKKLLAIKKCNPDKPFYVVFEKARNKIASGSKTTYSAWAEKQGIEWSETVPREEWFKHGVEQKREGDCCETVSGGGSGDKVGGTRKTRGRRNSGG